MMRPRLGGIRRRGLQLAPTHVLSGIAVGVLLLHPETMAVYWFEFHPQIEGVSSAWEFVLWRVGGAFDPGMLPMAAVFAALGGVLGAGSTVYAATLRRTQRRLLHLEAELEHAVPALIRDGEGERVEFKATARWDLREERTNRALAEAIVRSVAGFANAAGGTLLIGIADDGEIVSLERDYGTLRSPDRDGFERFVMDLIASRLGAHSCALVHVVFHRLEGEDICRLTVESAPRPVFVEEGGRSHLYVRTGNGTRELDAREALHHVRDSRMGTYASHG